MKTQTTYPGKKALKAILCLAAAFLLVQSSLYAGDSASVKRNLSAVKSSKYESAKSALETSTGNIPSFFLEEAIESELEIEEWMSNIQNDSMGAGLDEEEVELEEWMCNPNDEFWQDFYSADEEEFAIEDWMTNPDEWLNSENEVMLTVK